MKKVLLVLALLVCSISLGQSLNSNSKSLKENNLKEFRKIELLVQNRWKQSEPIYNIMINAQVDARVEVANIMRGDLTSSQLRKVNAYMDLSDKVVGGVTVYNWVLLNTFMRRL